MTGKYDYAFPLSYEVAKQIGNGYGFPTEYMGFTKREVIAKNIIAALLQVEYAGTAKDVLIALGLPTDTIYKRDYYYQLIANDTIVATDALIEALNKQQ